MCSSQASGCPWRHVPAIEDKVIGQKPTDDDMIILVACALETVSGAPVLAMLKSTPGIPKSYQMRVQSPKVLGAMNDQREPAESASKLRSQGRSGPPVAAASENNNTKAKHECVQAFRECEPLCTVFHALLRYHSAIVANAVSNARVTQHLQRDHWERITQEVAQARGCKKSGH
ncbi:hypothetical protein FA15DRAFT_709825 [Coprinopsis marcescibilis]|uniref:Uncharacterized protein n=1 Tax=Coprinopsis marcescibilis TaxID=230819 RepID=A0A5C3KEN0_COPMA|nr:hypothetical protein FA15DRAFT_709825 [Coprinopsis marcescibilis]